MFNSASSWSRNLSHAIIKVNEQVESELEGTRSCEMARVAAAVLLRAATGGELQFLQRLQHEPFWDALPPVTTDANCSPAYAVPASDRNDPKTVQVKGFFSRNRAGKRTAGL